MDNVLVRESSLEAIADAIREKLNTEDTYKPGEMANAIESISGGGITPTGTINITTNGTHNVTNYASANVNVPTGGSSLGTKSITANGTYNASSDSLDGYSQVTVNVPQGVTPTGTKQISITQNGTTTEDVTNYANAEITVNVSGGGSTPPRLLDYREITLESTATSSNKLTVQLTPVDYYSIVVMIDTYPSAPDASEYIALIYQYSKYPAGGGAAKGDILRPAGTIGNDNNMCSFANTTGVLSLGGSYGHFMAGTKYHVYLFGMGVAS